MRLRSSGVHKTNDKPVRNLKARYVFPATDEPLHDGLVTIRGERIVSVGRGAVQGKVEDLGNVAVLPGLVNAHTHLEFSNLAEPLGRPGMPPVDWLRLVVDRFRQGARSSHQAIERGLHECLCRGTTALGEIAQPDWPIELFQNSPLDTTVFLELIAPTTDRIAPLLARVEQHLQAAGAEASCGWRPGLSPHAPYSVLPELFDAAVSLSAARHVPIAFHLAESREELELLRGRSGPLRQFLDELGAWNPKLFTAGARPLDYLQRLSAAHRTLVIHGNYLDDEEIVFLGSCADRMSVVYCPRTHAYFAHPRYPLEKLLSAGATVALGTDSRASSPDLSVLAEMRLVAREYPAVDRNVVLQLGTIRAARALGRQQALGSLEPGKRADLAVVALADREETDPFELLFDSEEPVVQTWCRGRPT